MINIVGVTKNKYVSSNIFNVCNENFFQTSKKRALEMEGGSETSGPGSDLENVGILGSRIPFCLLDHETLGGM